ncbi:MAG: hypothetical protein ABI778_05835, partial [Ignavibacteriota bacterium]
VVRVIVKNYQESRISSRFIHWASCSIIEAVFCLLILVQSPFLTSCSNTVDTQTVHDTTTVIKHDTIPGPAFVRFLAMLNNTVSSGIITLRTENPSNAIIFTEVKPEMGKQFIPIVHDSSLFLYANYFYGANIQKFDSINIPSFKPYTLHTIVLFRTDDPGDPNRLFPIFADDSARSKLAPKDSCYVRLINGLADYPQPTPSVNLYLDDINSQPFFKDASSGIASPVNYQEFRNYTLMPIGDHRLYVRSQTDVAQSYFSDQHFVQGGYYTIRLSGKRSTGTDQLNIDSE